MSGFAILFAADPGAANPGGPGSPGATSMTAAAGSAGVRARRASEGDGAEQEAGSFAAALMMVQAQTDTPPEAFRVDTSLDRLDPEFRRRLERVMQRMRNEYGHEVRLVEGFRDAARQDFLYAQGRTRPGPVVTWTRDSAHEHGLAADLLVDGRYDNPEGYARLAQVAREEGLRTLGPADAGHVELVRPATAQHARAEAATGRPANQTAIRPANALARPAVPAAVVQVAAAPAAVAAAAPVAVANTAPVARVATVAQVAPAPGAAAAVGREVGRRIEPAPGSARGRAAVEDGADIGSVARLASAPQVAGDPRAEPATRLAASRGNRDNHTRDAADDRGSGQELALAADGGRFEPRSTNAADVPAGDVAARGATAAASSASPVEAATAGDVERVVRVLELQEAADAAPRSRVVLRLEDADGGVGRVRVDLRGSAVDAEISVPDRRLAARLDARIDALDSALRREGLVPESLRAQAAPAIESSEAARHAFSAPATSLESASGTASGGAADRDRRGEGHDPTRDAHRRDANDRQRSSREDRHERGRPW